MNKFIPGFSKTISLGIIAWAFCFYCPGQYSQHITVWNQLIGIEKDTSLSYEEKLPKLFILKKQFENSRMIEDSVYARILHRIGLYEYLLNNEVATKNAISFTQAAIRINSNGKNNSAPSLCVNGYANLGNFYKSLHLYNIAVQYYDSSLMRREQYYVPNISKTVLLLTIAQMLYRTGDYQKAVEKLNIAILNVKAGEDSALLPGLLNQRAQSNIMQGQLQEALEDVNGAADLSQLLKDNAETINSMLIKADIFAKRKDFSKAILLYKEGIKQRLRTNDYSQISDDYTDFGNFYLNDQPNYPKAKDCYLNTIKFAIKAQDFERLAKGHINLEQCSFRQHDYRNAERFCIEAMQDLKLTADNNILINPSAAQITSIGNKELILTILRNKAELLLNQFIKIENKNYLSACLQTAMLTDTLITKIRHEQLGEQSKLYWRNWTREFFTQAMEACYLCKDASLAFYFMEKSRAVLLNDKLNELGASAHLPQAEAIKEHELQITVISEQQKLASFQSTEEGYDLQQSKLLQAKSNLERYIKSLEKKYPAYYQYKYSDDVPSLNTLQKQLREIRQSFVHYFMNDTVAYILGITPSDAKLIKLSKHDFNTGSLKKFLQLCSFEPTLNNQFLSFASLSYSLYKLLFQPLKIPGGKVVICPDNFLIPFEALCTDDKGNNFLVNDYIFSYVYSARYFLKKYDTYEAKDNFIGFAPVSFKAYPDIVDLKHSADALKQSAKYYNNSTLFTNETATRHNFLQNVSSYTIVNIFSHARADTTESEPVLYLRDSVIHLSELQLLENPATRLVVLSACQTHVGKSATGEGVFSLARGFALAGIPSVAATLWAADEQTIYTISEKFHEFLSQGMAKDEALQKAKLFFIKNSSSENPFPYYWANMILIGNEEPLKLSENHHAWWWIAIIIFLSAFTLLMRKKRSASFHD
jgi:CHAT domain-containing protein